MSSPSIYGQAVTFTASVATTAGAGLGNVTFKAGVSILGSGSVSGGTGSYTTTASQLLGGTDLISAYYSGDSDHSGSTSSAYSQTVSKAATSTTLASSRNPAPAEQSVTLTATVDSTAGTPSGNVLFRDGGTVLGTVALGGDTAQLTSSFATTGTHHLRANYDGNRNYADSTGTIAQIVQ